MDSVHKQRNPGIQTRLRTLPYSCDLPVTCCSSEAAQILVPGGAPESLPQPADTSAGRAPAEAARDAAFSPAERQRRSRATTSTQDGEASLRGTEQ